MPSATLALAWVTPVNCGVPTPVTLVTGVVVARAELTDSVGVVGVSGLKALEHPAETIIVLDVVDDDSLNSRGYAIEHTAQVTSCEYQRVGACVVDAARDAHGAQVEHRRPRVGDEHADRPLPRRYRVGVERVWV